MRFKTKNGYVVKRKARLNHVCHICNETIKPNEEYYQLHYYDSWGIYPVCEGCWSGIGLNARNKVSYKETERFATEGDCYG